MGLAQPSDPPMAAGNNRLADILTASLHPRTNKEGPSLLNSTLREQTLIILSAELALRQEERQPGFSVTLLQIVATPDCDDVTRLASSLYFKNFIRRWWTVRASSSQKRCDTDLVI